MRIGLIADIHGNLRGLEQSLAVLDRSGCDEIICLGDALNLGPDSVGVCRLLRSRAIPTVLGNADAWLTSKTMPLAEPPTSDPTISLTAWTQSLLQPPDIAWIESLPLVISRSIQDWDITFCHGSPASVDDVLAEHTCSRDLDRWLPNGIRRVIVTGHTHVALRREHNDGILINPGSSGLPGVGPETSGLATNGPVDWVECAALELDGSADVMFHRLPIPLDELTSDAHNSHMPCAEWWISRWGTTS